MDSTEKRYETIRKRLEALWENEILDRCCVSVLAPRDPQRPYRENPPESQEDLCRWYNDAQWIQERNLERIRRTYFAGDAFPCIFPYFGTGGHAKYICAEEKVEYRRDTIWIHPSLSDYFDYNYEFDPDSNKVFRRELDVVSYLAKEANGRYFVGMPDNCGSYDALAQLRGSGELLIDFLDEPEGVKYAAGQLIEILKRSSKRFFDAVRENCLGGSVTSWMNTWSAGRQLQLQCDLSVMLSPAIYREFITPELTETAGWLDNAVYHLDGMEQIRHLDEILGVDGIQMIQWTQVAGQPPVTEFIPVLRRIQKAGKGLVLIIGKAQLPCLLENLSSNGLNLIVTNAKDPQEAEEIVRFTEKNTRETPR